MIHLVLADDQAIFRAGAARVLAAQEDMRIVAQCETPASPGRNLSQVLRLRSDRRIFAPPSLAGNFRSCPASRAETDSDYQT